MYLVTSPLCLTLYIEQEQSHTYGSVWGGDGSTGVQLSKYKRGGSAAHREIADPAFSFFFRAHYSEIKLKVQRVSANYCSDLVGG